MRGPKTLEFVEYAAYDLAATEAGRFAALAEDESTKIRLQEISEEAGANATLLANSDVLHDQMAVFGGQVLARLVAGSEAKALNTDAASIGEAQKDLRTVIEFFKKYKHGVPDKLYARTPVAKQLFYKIVTTDSRIPRLMERDD